MKLTSTAALAVALTGAFALPATALGAPAPERVAGNPTCADLGSGLRQLKVDPVPQGTSSFRDGALSGSLVVSGSKVAFTANQGVDAVIVKGGPNANVYRYSPEVRSDRDLVTPTNPSNGKPYGLSHVSFCYDNDGKGTPPSKGTPPTDGGTPKQHPTKGQPSKGTPPKGTPPEECKKGKGKGCAPAELRGRMTGHGHVFTEANGKVAWEFRNSVCGADRFPDLKVGYDVAGVRQTFILTAYSSPLRCEDTAASEGKPVAGFDTIIGQGTGTLNGQPATITFSFTDAGEPGRADSGSFTIVGPNGVSLNVVAQDGGNHQAHRLTGRDAR